ncbi:MAG: endonuclease domain-containing protein [Chloroflexi bacterium]|nr:endonuclease domain-containing protein [Chloroflexota bacterium]MCH9009470.1 endonuclease domain-containing protein [Chloroflexota bacterium]
MKISAKSIKERKDIPSTSGGRLGWGSSLRDRARDLRRNSTETEKVLWKHLRLKQLAGYRFRRQHTIGNFIVDFFCFEKGLAIELDGGHHTVQGDYDQKRTLWLESRGYKVLRFWNSQIMTEMDAVKEVILKELKAIK